MSNWIINDVSTPSLIDRLRDETEIFYISEEQSLEDENESFPMLVGPIKVKDIRVTTVIDAYKIYKAAPTRYWINRYNKQVYTEKPINFKEDCWILAERIDKCSQE